MNNNTSGYELSFRKVTDVFRQFFVWIILIVVFFGAVATIFTELFIDEVYSTTVRFYVKDSENSTNVTPQQISAADTHAYSAMEILAAGECRENLGISDMNVTITTTKRSNTPMFIVKVSSTDKMAACKAAEIIRDDFPAYVYSKTTTGSLSSYDFSGVDKVADSPNLLQNIIIGAMLGFIISFILFFLRIVLDTVIHSEEEVKSMFSYSILGAIPTMSEDANQGTDYYSYKRK